MRVQQKSSPAGAAFIVDEADHAAVADAKTKIAAARAANPRRFVVVSRIAIRPPAQ
jgi:predicted TIM-barrel fold metal-dependent hydrolase